MFYRSKHIDTKFILPRLLKTKVWLSYVLFIEHVALYVRLQVYAVNCVQCRVARLEDIYILWYYV